MTSQADKAAAFRALHQRPGVFIMPNPWDAGTARILAGMGFPALATTSLGVAAQLGRRDGTGAVGAAEVLANARAIARATALPVSGDLENGYADDPETAAQIIAGAAEAGLVGGSIEDYSGDARRGIYPFDLAVARVEAAAAAARALPFPFTLTARAENLIRGRDDLADTIRRLQAFGEAGADVVYAPGLKDLETIATVTAALDKPVNVLMGTADPDLTVDALAAAGVKRISLGGALYRVAMAAFMDAAEVMRAGGFTFVRDMVPAGRLMNALDPER